jgi:hypothetical protein
MIGCTENITFTEPQPTKGKLLKFFPEKICGIFWNEDLGSILLINRNCMISTTDYIYRMHKTEVDSLHLTIETNETVSTENGESYRYEVTGDSIYLHVHFSDTVFCFSNKEILKKYKGHYFLNKQIDTLSWEVTLFKIQNGELAFSEIETQKEIELLREITETKEDTMSRIFTPTQRQFKKFLSSGGFTKETDYLKIKN